MSEQIIIKSMKDKARDLINIYHDSPENFSNMLKENIANSLDIFKKNFSHRPNNEIKIILHNSNKIEFIDNASGIPVEGSAKMGDGSDVEIPNYQAIFEIDGAGSNYNKDIDSAGQHGVFLYTLSMSSEDIEYFIARPNGNVYNIAYHKGDRVKDLNIIETNHDKNDTYTRIIFSLDNEVWVNPSFTFEEICEIAQPQASLYDNLTITVEDKKTNRVEVFHYDNSLIDYFNEKTSNFNIISDTVHIDTVEPYDFKKMGTNIDLHDDIKVNLYFNYNNDNDIGFKKEFVNTADLIQYGKVQDGIIDGLKYSINKWLETKGKYNKNEKHITNDDVMSCLNYICDVRCKYVKYAGQIKQSVKENKFKTILSKIIKEQLEIYFIENPLQTEKICNQVLINSRAREKADSTRKDIQKKLSNLQTSTKVKIEGLTDCDMSTDNVNDRWLLVVEGKSPKATVVEAYDNTCMGALGLKGRFISCLKTTVSKVLNNAPAYTLIQALGCGIEIPSEERKAFKDIKSFDESKLRYGNIGILTDADCWGSGIRLALLTFMYKYLPTLLKQNRVYIIISPRYEIKMKDGTMRYVYNDREKEEFMKTIDESTISHIGIVKGLGELNKDDFWDKVLSPEAREKTFIQVDYNEVDEIVNGYFEDYMGDDTQPRKDFVKEFITNVKLDEIN